MFRFITEIFHRLIESLDLSQTRYLYPSFNPYGRTFLLQTNRL